MSSNFRIADRAKFDGQDVVFRGWVGHKRSSGKIKFLVMRDGSGWMQGILAKGQCEDESFEAFEQLTQETSIEVQGRIRAEARSPSGFEMDVKKIRAIQIAEPYPISPKEHGVEFLMDHRHLWLRSQRQWAALRIRSEIFRAVEQFFYDDGFIRFDAPILTPSSCEGTSTLFTTPYFDEKAFLTQSGQLYGEVGAMAFGKVFVFGPTFRAEKSKTRKHLTEFWMVEPEVAFADLTSTMELGEKLVEYVVQTILAKCAPELKLLERNIAELEQIRGPFPRVSYDDAIKILEKRGVAIPWGEDLGAPHETALGEEFNKPVFLHHMPAEIKAFYFKQSDSNDAMGGEGLGAAHGKYALGCDLIAPNGYGEIIGGGVREDNEALLLARVKAHGLNMDDYQWYVDLRRFGSVPHGGFGMGLERVVAWITGVEHVRETIPFPRLMNYLRP